MGTCRAGCGLRLQVIKRRRATIGAPLPPPPPLGRHSVAFAFAGLRSPPSLSLMSCRDATISVHDLCARDAQAAPLSAGRPADNNSIVPCAPLLDCLPLSAHGQCPFQMIHVHYYQMQDQKAKAARL